ncbi:Sphingomyelin phosphodiesterase [Amphibalanus amphitrite]|uniref:Sphingomyelin phosphodiesterase n=1 Tax=Amphibalanus amphitrite TaxID=1232801 RepID=A0A6A4V4M4_AMPAM|nr:Sphingomyelin phosphodiesterase [Amphibalanus amphitrite]
MRFLLEAHRSYVTGQMRPYVQYAKKEMRVTEVHNILRNRPGGIPRWPAPVQDLLCTECEFAIAPVLLEFYSGTPIDQIAEQAIEACVVLDLYDEEVCRGAVTLAIPTIAEVLSARRTTAAEVCTYVIGAQCGSVIWPQWEVQLPDTPKPPHIEPVLPDVSETTTIKVLQLSDLHVDLDYAEGSEAFCNMPMCCHASQGVGNATTGPYGALADCDIPMATLDATLDWITENHADVDIIYLTGDLPAHDIWNQTREGNEAAIRTSLTKLQARFPNTPVYSSIGNHAPCFINIYPPATVESETNSVEWLEATFGELWPALFPTEITEGTIDRGSFYASRAIPGKLRVISINSNFCNNLNWLLLLDSVDPNGELQWLVEQLQEAEDLGEKVHLLSHIPPGITDCLPTWSHQFNRIVNRYEDTISGQFYGHTHKDEFEVFYDLEDAGRAVSVAYITPAVTTYSYKNPTYRIFHVDTNSTWMAVDYDTYWMDLERANAVGDTSYSKLYSARADLLEAPPTPQNFDRLVQRMKTDSDKFQQYMSYYYHSDAAQVHYGPCEGACRDQKICGTETSDSSNPRC